MSEWQTVTEGKDTLYIEPGYTRADNEHVYKAHVDKKSEKTYYVNLATHDKTWKLPKINAKDAEGAKEKKKHHHDSEKGSKTGSSVDLVSEPSGKKSHHKHKEGTVEDVNTPTSSKASADDKAEKHKKHSKEEENDERRTPKTKGIQKSATTITPQAVKLQTTLVTR